MKCSSYVGGEQLTFRFVYDFFKWSASFTLFLSLSFFLSSCVDGDGTKESAGISKSVREKEKVIGEREDMCE